MISKNKFLTLFFLLLAVTVTQAQKGKKQATPGPITGAVWSAEKANAWYERHGWLVGCNYIPHNAINQLEMWQAETFDLKTIDEELGWLAVVPRPGERVLCT